MLSPLDALSLAGTLIQFLDFTTKVLSQSHQLYETKETALPANQELEFVSADLFTLAQKLPKPVAGWGMEEVCGRRAFGNQDEQALQKLAISCSNICLELSTKLNSLKVRSKHKKWGSLHQALRSVWSEAEIANLTRRLSVCRDSLQMHIVVGLRNQADTMALDQSHRFDDLDKATQNIVLALLRKEDRECSAIQAQTMAIGQLLGRVELIAESQKSVEDTLKSINANDDQQINVDTGDNVPREQLFLDFQESETQIRLKVADEIIGSLWFPAFLDREEAIENAHRKTFRWIFSENDQNIPWDNFSQWLHHGSGIYWVNGKAASGKSTLMRFIHDHPTTLELLKNWASPLPVSTARFYFWNSGTLEQRSQSGLFRAILAEILKSHKELVPIVFPLHWAQRYTQLVEPFNYSGLNRREPSANPDSWGLSELRQAFDTLLHHQIGQFKMCLFIDGLDEYEGDHEHIAELFGAISTSSWLKICVSSRPLLVFDDAFKSVPSLRLQDLTASDINDYVTSKFHDNIHFKRLAQKEPLHAPELVANIVSRASGVFLWVKLVVLDLLKGLGNRDDLHDLQRRLDLLPRDLEELFKSMFRNIHPFYMDNATEIFLIARTAHLISEKGASVYSKPLPTRALDTLTLSLAVDPDKDLLTRIKKDGMSKGEEDWRHQQISDQLKVRCAGLLETGKGPSFTSRHSVEYLHRTTRDWLERPDVLKTLVSQEKETGFDPSTAVLRSLVMQFMTFDRNLLTPNTIERFETSALLYAHEADQSRQKSNSELLELMDRSLVTLLQSRPSLDGSKGHRLASRLQFGFLPIAVQFDLCSYVLEKVQQPDFSGDRMKQLLLLYALGLGDILSAQTMDNLKWRHRPSPKMVALLARQGAQVNQTVGLSKPFKSFVKRASQIWPIDEALQDQKVEIKNDLQIIETMLEHGADASACILTSGNGYHTARRVLTDRLSRCWPSEALRVDAMFTKHGGSLELSFYQKWVSAE